MDIEKVDEDLRLKLAATPSPDVTKPAVRWLIARLSGLVKAVPTEGVAVSEVRDGPARMRIHRPDAPRTDAALLWVHGGGLVIGSPKQDDPLVGGTARELGMVAVAARYRLAPGRRFPAALDDVVAAWDWLQEHAADLGVDPARVIIGGESAGAGLAAAASQRLLDRAASEGTRTPIGQWLFAPMLDDRTAANRTLDAIDHPVWNNRANLAGWSAYLGQEPGAAEAPAYAVPARRTDLTGLPPAWITWGDIELFAAEDAAYAARLQAAGVDTTIDIVPGGARGFENWARETPPAVALVARARAWLAATTAG